MDLVILPIIWLAHAALNIYFWIVIAAVISSWLVAFKVINSDNQFVRMLLDFLYRLTEPLFSRIRNVLPDMGGIDFSPIVVLLGIGAVQYFLQLLASKVVPTTGGF